MWHIELLEEMVRATGDAHRAMFLCPAIPFASMAQEARFLSVLAC